MAAQLPFPSTSIDEGFIDEPFAVFKPAFANYRGILELFRHITQQDLSHASAVDAFCDQLSLHVEGVPLRCSSHILHVHEVHCQVAAADICSHDMMHDITYDLSCVRYT